MNLAEILCHQLYRPFNDQRAVVTESKDDERRSASILSPRSLHVSSPPVLSSHTMIHVSSHQGLFSAHLPQLGHREREGKSPLLDISLLRRANPHVQYILTSIHPLERERERERERAHN